MRVRLVLPLVAAAVATLPPAPPVARAATPERIAYVVIGDLDQNAVSMGVYGDPYEAVKPLVAKKRHELQMLGYRVEDVDPATPDHLRKALLDPRLGAVAWFGHGDPTDPGSFTVFGTSDEHGRRKELISFTQLHGWAKDKWAIQRGWDGKGNRDDWLKKKWARDNGWNGKGTPDDFILQSGAVSERFNRTATAMERATFGLDYGYFHTCYGFDRTDRLIRVMTKRDASSRLFGYKGVKYHFDEDGVKQAAWIDGKPVVGEPADIERQRLAELAEKAAPAPSRRPSGEPGATPPGGGARGPGGPRSVSPGSETAGRAGRPPAEPEAIDPRHDPRDRVVIDEEDDEEYVDPFAEADSEDDGWPADDGEDDDDEELWVFDDEDLDEEEPFAIDDEELDPFEVEDDDPDHDRGGSSGGQSPAAAPGPGSNLPPSQEVKRPEGTTSQFDGEYAGAGTKSGPLTMRIRNGEVSMRVGGVVLKGWVDGSGNLKARCRETVGEIENANPGSVAMEPLIGAFEAEGYVSGKLANGSMTVQLSSASLGAEPPLRESWSCSRD
ncbi:MAG: hypothetical protein MUC56_11910 [Thermoanaerobaculales bacterium]|nr:hypothetical protein [Thermoanaerobaculales bacterium]